MQVINKGARYPRGQSVQRAMLVGHRMGDHKLIIKALDRAPPCFGRHVKPLVPVAFEVVSTTNLNRVRSFFLCVIHKEVLYPSSGDINRLMIMQVIVMSKCENVW
jgi:hypothetical protein